MQVSYSIADCFHVAAIPVIASFTPKGEIAPVYVRIEEEPLKVHSYFVLDRNIAGISFSCKLECHGIIRTVELYYSFSEHTWFQSHYIPFT